LRPGPGPTLAAGLRAGQYVDEAVAASPATLPPPDILNRATMDDIFGYIYTSGTTGLPKAAVIRHWRMYGFAATFVNSFLVCRRSAQPDCKCERIADAQPWA